MKKKWYVAFYIVALAMCFGGLSGCGKSKAPETEETTAEENTVQESETTSESAVEDENVIHVNTTQALIESIAPGVEIVLDEGIYNISEFLLNIENQESYELTEYMSIAYLDDGPYVSMQCVSDVVIRGKEGECPTLIVDKTTGTYLEFFECENIAFENLCFQGPGNDGPWGSLLEFWYCKNIRVDNVRFENSSAYGVLGYQVTNLLVKNSSMEKCGAGMTSISQGTDVNFENCQVQNCGKAVPVERELSYVVDSYSTTMTFKQCTFSDNALHSGMVCNKPESVITFEQCKFGQNETSLIATESSFYGNILFDESCEFEGTLDRNIVVVSSSEELLDAIAPRTTIFLKPGKYNLSKYVEKIWPTNQREVWDNTYEYVRPMDCYDGVELVIEADGLAIVGMSKNPKDTEIVVTPRDVNVLAFDSCVGICMANLTLGHTEMGECSGNVMTFSECEGVVLSNLDLYGCGYYGIDISNYDVGADYYIFDSVIHDCSAGPFCIYNEGVVNFQNCVMENSEDVGYFSSFGGALFFNKCRFGERESLMKFWSEGDMAVSEQDCIWSEEYGDYSDTYDDVYDDAYDAAENSLPELSELNEGNLTKITSDVEVYLDTWWNGFAIRGSMEENFSSLPEVDDVTGAITDYHVDLCADGTGCFRIENTGGGVTESNLKDFTWKMEEGQTAFFNGTDSDLYGCISFYADNNGSVLMKWEDPFCDIWFY